MSQAGPKIFRLFAEMQQQTQMLLVDIRNLCVSKRMIDRTSIASALYSRQQVARLTGIDDSTLNYWMREGVLQAAEGGTGKGQHRRFPYHQINLALLLDQLRGFGVSLPAIKRLADRFHSAIAFYAEAGVSRANDEAVTEIISLRHQLEKDGVIVRQLKEDMVSKFVEVFPWLAGRKLYREHSHLWYKFDVTFEEALDLLRKGHIVYDRAADFDGAITDEVVDLAMKIDLAARAEAYSYWSAITYIEPRAPEEAVDGYYTPLIVYRNSDGEWEITSGDPSSSMLSYVGVYLERLGGEAWSKL